MKLLKKYFWLLTLPLAALLTRCDGGSEPLRYTYSFDEPFPAAVTDRDVTIRASYTVNTDTDPTFEAGLSWKVAGEPDSDAHEGKPESYKAGTRHLAMRIRGLAPATTYSVRILTRENSGQFHYGPWRDFTTKAPGSDQPTQPLWGELPTMKESDGVRYVTHYVTSDGNQMASSTDAYRVRNYTVAYDTQNFRTLWAAAPMHSWYYGNLDRGKDKWFFNPMIPTDVQQNVVNGSWGKPYNRGHLVASNDRRKSEALHNQTFYVTNQVPQVASFNAVIWANLEAKVKKWGNVTPDTLFVVTGLIYEGNKTVRDNSGKQIPVPSHFYKVLLTSKSGTTGLPVSELAASELKCVGFVMENIDHDDSTPSAKYMVKVADIEARVGYKFFPMLRGEAESVKNTKIPSDWGM